MLELRTLGGLELLQLRDGVVRAIPLQTKRLALLAYLAASSQDSFCRRDTLLALFWPELDQEHARGALRQALHFLRKTVGEGAIINRGEEEVGLNRAALSSDSQALESALDGGEPEAALVWYRGDFLKGVFVADASPDLEDWVAAERLRLRRLAAKAAWLAAERPTVQGNTSSLVRRAVQLSGDDERALRRGLAMLDQMGDHAGAAALYEGFADRVARDLEIELSPETEAAMRAVRARRPLEDGPHPARPDSPAEPTTAPEGAQVGATGPARPTRRLWAAGIAGALLILALAAYIGADRPVRAPAGSDLVVIAPFRVPDGDTSLAWLREGMVELLTIRLAGEGGLTVPEPATALHGWNRGAGPDGPRAAAVALAGRFGASRIIEGSITRERAELILTARLSAVSGSPLGSTAMVAGPFDSLPLLVDRLAAQLLGLGAGVERARLPSLASRSLPAIREYLLGRAAFRAGRVEDAVLHLREATMLDSTFALAALELSRAAAWSGADADVARGRRLARASQHRLNSADQALLAATTGQWHSAPEMFQRWNAVVAAYPTRPEGWYSLGDAHYHWGMLAGETDALERARGAFQRGWALDSAAAGTAPAVSGWLVGEPAEHLVELAQLRGDTAEVLRLTGRFLAVDSTSEMAWRFRWHRALIGDRRARAAFWAGLDGVSQKVSQRLLTFIASSGVGIGDWPRLLAADGRRLRSHDPGFAAQAFTTRALNAGRPHAVVRGEGVTGEPARALLRKDLRHALWWDGDTTAAVEAMRVLGRSADGPSATGTAARSQLYDICVVGEWRWLRGDGAAAATASRQLRAARVTWTTSNDSVRIVHFVELCAAVLDATHDTAPASAEARRKIATADSLARTFIIEVCCNESVEAANLVLARLWERAGDPSRALQAVRRRAGGYGLAPRYLSTFLREEGRLALVTGDTGAAVQAYRHYLALRPDPEPALKPGEDSIRATLARLEAR